MVKKTGILLLALVLPSALYGNCKPVQIEKGDADFPALRRKKIEYALIVIENGRYLAHEPSCVSAAMRYLGEAHVDAAIPQIVRLLTFAVPTPQCDGPGPIVGGVETGCGPNGPYPWVTYPALDALHRIGKPAAPTLIKAMAATPVTSNYGKNALDAFMDIYRENLGQGIRALQLAAAKQTDPMAKSRLIEASENARSQWCRSSPCDQ